jgi:hypothetical protein
VSGVAAPQTCLSCDARNVAVLLDFGPQPPSNRFERQEAAPAERHPLVVAQCQACGLMQLANPMSPAMVKSHFEWLSYNEPEGHLDDLVERLRALPGMGREARIVGLTYKDDSTLARLNRFGYENTYRYDPALDLGVTDHCAGLESLQRAFDAGRTQRLAACHGQADLIIARHILEHVHLPKVFIRALKQLAKPGAYVVFEVPDAAKFIRACDYSFVWEEHVTYFNRPTLLSLVRRVGMEVYHATAYSYPLEDSLIAIAQNIQPPTASTQQDIEMLRKDGQRFAERYAETRTSLQTLLTGWRSQGRRVAVFGAGHLAAKFINLHDLAGLLEYVVDDNPRKQALLMPGCRLPIRGTDALISGQIELCLLSLNPESEQKVRDKYASYLERGGRFSSIFALSPQAVHRMAA